MRLLLALALLALPCAAQYARNVSTVGLESYPFKRADIDERAALRALDTLVESGAGRGDDVWCSCKAHAGAPASSVVTPGKCVGQLTPLLGIFPDGGCHFDIILKCSECFTAARCNGAFKWRIIAEQGDAVWIDYTRTEPCDGSLETWTLVLFSSYPPGWLIMEGEEAVTWKCGSTVWATLNTDCGVSATAALWCDDCVFNEG